MVAGARLDKMDSLSVAPFAVHHKDLCTPFRGYHPTTGAPLAAPQPPARVGRVS